VRSERKIFFPILLIVSDRKLFCWLTFLCLKARGFFRGIKIMRNLIQSTELPNTLVQHCAMPIAPTLSAISSIESTCLPVDSLASKSLLAKARSRVSRDTNSTTEVKHLLTTTSYSREFHPSLKVKVSVLILTYLSNITPCFKHGVMGPIFR